MPGRPIPAAIGRIIARAWRDESFLHRLIADTRQVIREYGGVVESDIDYRVVVDTPSVRYLVIPPKPSDDLIERPLEDFAAQSSSELHFCFPCMLSAQTFSAQISARPRKVGKRAAKKGGVKRRTAAGKSVGKAKKTAKKSRRKAKPAKRGRRKGS